MTSVSASGQQALEALYWRAEILQAMFWLRGEGIDSEVDPGRLAEFLAVDRSTVETQMETLASEGFLAVLSPTSDVAVGAETATTPRRYALTETGIAEGGRSFQDEFAALTHAAHYECAPGCWCHDPDHAGEPCPSTPAPVHDPPATPPDVPRPRPAEDQHGR